MKIVFSYGGSVLAPEKVDFNFIDKVSDFLVEVSKKHQVAVVVGGGFPAREKISEAKKRGLTNAKCDYEGIMMTKKNARLILEQLGSNAIAGIPDTIPTAGEMFGGKIVVMGGTEPGHSTDAVAALVADWVDADLLVNASNIQYVYDKNPKDYKDAKPLDKISPKKLVEMVVHLESGPGQYALIDIVAAKVIERSQIKTIVLDGRDIDNMKNAIEGKPFNGTTIE